MNTAVCTLIEGHYHHGLSALVNSLVKNGFRGDVFAGYRGELPKWAFSAKDNVSFLWPRVKTLAIEETLYIHFLPIETDYHLANYKPEFILRLFDGPAKQADAIAYFDPDIVVKSEWHFYEKWMSRGVALVHEITCNDMPKTHPVRLEWEEIIQKTERVVRRDLRSYINSGFCGVAKLNKQFVQDWSFIMHIATTQYNLDVSSFSHETNRSHPFFAKDQDALNVAAMFTVAPISEIGPEGMDFIPGGFTMSHAIGNPKPWKKSFILSAIKGRVPSVAEKAFWENAAGPVNSFSKSTLMLKKASIMIAAFIGRFYRRY